MPSISMMSPPPPVLRSSATLVLNASSPAPFCSNLIVAVTPLAFCCSVNFGITQFCSQFAPRAFFPPSAAFATIVSVISLASAFFA